MAKRIPGVGGVVSAGEDVYQYGKDFKKDKKLPSSEQVIGTLEKIPGTEKVTKALTGVVSCGKVAAKLAHGELPTIDETTAILKSIPGMEDVADIGNMSAKLAKSAG